ncbi:bacteriocin [uncultured Draconibacterium sp.]|nr:bacteriocin [uncultured Draconibacterium sp.]
MNAITAVFTSTKLDNFEFEVLSQNELNEVRGGGQPKSRDKDIYDFEEE